MTRAQLGAAVAGMFMRFLEVSPFRRRTEHGLIFV